MTDNYKKLAESGAADVVRLERMENPNGGTWYVLATRKNGNKTCWGEWAATDKGSKAILTRSAKLLGLKKLNCDVAEAV